MVSALISGRTYRKCLPRIAEGIEKEVYCMSRMIRRRWRSKFARFIQDYGVESLAKRLDVRPSAIYHWIRGSTTPRPAHAEIMQRLARERGSRLTMDVIYGHFRAVRADNIKLGNGLSAFRSDDGFPSSGREFDSHRPLQKSC
jgi:hypothetical protein